ncbi:NYN domain-containing protein [Granulicella cerasi]|uniref:NYN domain-containing protein n=1 Tax=Granulicella cerasi TaxID=741063 RepID=A0ABW1ZBU4_9BACT|nr:NYN domain-containing protein [Granulicella cerasi]
MLRTSIYVDGFNLYYRALRRTPFRWLNIHELAVNLLSAENQIHKIRYFTARVSGKQDPGNPVRQALYLRALESLPQVEIHYGSFLARRKMRPLADPLPGGPTHVEIEDMEEKGSDVNLATHLLNDAWKDDFDVALLLSQDSDLLEPLRIVREELAKTIGIVSLDGREPGSLKKYASFVRTVTPERLRAAQFPEVLEVGNRGKIIRRPPQWA